ncbi:MAG: membrane protein insertase YidC [Candidatus Paracaedibacteraceae bacterium]|nr:membrane protein insertase YidC [Candidatus Paracaedibacteraceae bacterium]
MSEQKNLIIAIASSIAIYWGFDYFYTPIAHPNAKAITATQSASSLATSTVLVQSQDLIIPREVALKDDQRVRISTPKIQGSIRLKGAIIDDVELTQYKETTDENSSNVVVLTPQQTKNAYTASFKWIAKDGTSCPDENTVWKIEGKDKFAELTPEKPLVLFFDNKKGLRFTRTIKIDENYLFTVTDTVANSGAAPVLLQPVNQISRYGTPTTGGYFVLHEGAIGVLNHSLTELSYSDIEKKGAIQQDTTDGWLGFTDKYWLVALIPSQTVPTHCSYEYHAGSIYKSIAVGAEVTLDSGKTTEISNNLFVGPKVLKLLDAYEKKLGIYRLELAVDFGWFYFLTKPLFYVLEFFHKLLGNFGLAILALTVLFKAVLFPLANKSHRSMARMKTLQPKMEKIKTTYGHDKVRMNQELMNLYKTESVNPMSGCLPMLIQAPIFFCLYKVFFVTIEMRHAPFFGWIHDLAAIDPTSLFNLFGLIPWTPPAFLMIGAWPIIMGATMVLQQRLGPQPADAQQAKIMMIMPVMFTYLFASFPAGLVIYWAWSNVLTILQQFYINRSTEIDFANRKPAKHKKR